MAWSPIAPPHQSRHVFIYWRLARLALGATEPVLPSRPAWREWGAGGGGAEWTTISLTIWRRLTVAIKPADVVEGCCLVAALSRDGVNLQPLPTGRSQSMTRAVVAGSVPRWPASGPPRAGRARSATRSWRPAVFLRERCRGAKPSVAVGRVPAGHPNLNGPFSTRWPAEVTERNEHTGASRRAGPEVVPRPKAALYNACSRSRTIELLTDGVPERRRYRSPTLTRAAPRPGAFERRGAALATIADGRSP